MNANPAEIPVLLVRHAGLTGGRSARARSRVAALARLGFVTLIAACLAGPVFGQAPPFAPAGLFIASQDLQEPQSPIQVPDVIPARQVTLFGVLATPLTASERPARDEKLETIEPQLRKLLPNHSFRLLNVQSRRLTLGQSMTCMLGDGFVASTTLLHPFDENGKVQLRCSVTYQQVPQIERLVGTPPNQLFFCEKPLPNGQRLLVGIGAR